MKMSVMTEARPVAISPDRSDSKATMKLRRRTIDKVLIGSGVAVAVVFAAAGGLLTWGSNFAEDYVHDELSSQHVVFPDAESLREDGRADLVKYAEEPVTTGAEAEAYASLIATHMEGIADGKTYAEIDDRGAAEAVEDAKAAGAPQSEIDELQAKATQLKGQRDSLFRGETLRGLLLTSYAWATMGLIAGIAAWVAFGAAAVMVLLVVLGFWHLRATRPVRTATT
jgi:hypothetical protein